MDCPVQIQWLLMAAGVLVVFLIGFIVGVVAVARQHARDERVKALIARDRERGL